MKVKLFRSEFYVKQIRCQEENNLIIEVEKANDEEHKTNIFFSPDGQYSVMIYEGSRTLYEDYGATSRKPISCPNDKPKE